LHPFMRRLTPAIARNRLEPLQPRLSVALHTLRGWDKSFNPAHRKGSHVSHASV